MRIFTAIIALAIAAIAPNAAEAIPAFSKKYEITCSACHSAWPRLNDYGYKFKVNGYQLPESEDGGETSKLNPGGGNLFLDIGKANPPISLTLDGGLGLFQSVKGETSDRNDKFFCCVNGAAATVDMGGTVAPNIGYWISLPWGKEDVAQGYLRFVNWFGPGMVGLDIGAMKVVDNDVVAAGQEWFSSPLVAFYGHPSNTEGQEIGMTAPHNDTGLRFYGRPAFGMFSYEAGLFSGAKLTGAGEDDTEKAYTAMGRIDLERFAGSIRYWGNKTGFTSLTGVTQDGQSITFPANSLNPDENTQELILSARYRHPYFEVDATFDRTSFSVSDRQTTGSDGAVHTISQGGIGRTALSVGAIWFVNNWFQTGIAYGMSKYGDYDVTVDGYKTTITNTQVSLVQWKLQIMPTENVKLGVELQLDTTPEDARKRSDGTSFDPQNKALLQWSMSL